MQPLIITIVNTHIITTIQSLVFEYIIPILNETLTFII